LETLVIQTGTRHGRYAELTRSHEGSLTIGRGFDNDLVLTDVHVAPQQLKFLREGDHWRLVVLDDTNPVLLNGNKVIGDSPIVKSGDRLVIGRTKLSLFAEDHQVEPTRKLMRSNWRSDKPISPFLPVILLLLACLFDSALTYFESSTNLKWEELAAAELMSAVLIVIWAGIWAIAGRIVRHQHQYGRQIIATLAAFVFGGVLAILSEYIVQPFHSASVEELTGWIVFFVTFSLLLCLNLTIATNIYRPGLVSSMFAGLVIAVTYGLFVFLETETYLYEPAYSASLKPPIIRLYKGIPLEEYFSEASEIFESLEDEREKQE